MGKDSTTALLEVVNSRLEELHDKENSPLVHAWGTPKYEIYSLDPFVVSSKFGRFRNRAPFYRGDVPVRAIANRQSLERPDLHYLSLIVQVGERMFPQPINIAEPEHVAVLTGIAKACGIDGVTFYQ